MRNDRAQRTSYLSRQATYSASSIARRSPSVIGVCSIAEIAYVVGRSIEFDLRHGAGLDEHRLDGGHIDR